MLRTATFLGGLLFALCVQAALSYNQFLQDSNNWSKMYLMGIHNGIHISNAQLMMDGRKRLYCMPANVRVDSAFLYKLLKNFVANHKEKDIGNMRVDWMLLYALTKEYPCKNAT